MIYILCACEASDSQSSLPQLGQLLGSGPRVYKKCTDGPICQPGHPVLKGGWANCADPLVLSFIMGIVTIHQYYCFPSLQGMMVTIPYVVYKHSIFPTQGIPRGSPGSQEVWKRDGFFYHYLICPLARKICQKLSCTGRLSNHAEVLGCWFLDPRHAGQLRTGCHCLRDSENLYFDDCSLCG